MMRQAGNEKDSKESQEHNFKTLLEKKIQPKV